MSDYDVGYGKPPKAKQFRPGKSGNPRGRPPKEERFSLPRQLRKDILCALEEEVTVSTSGGPKKMSRQQLIVKTIMHKASAGNPTAMKMCMELIVSALNERMAANGSVKLLDDILDQENRTRARLHDWDDPGYDIKEATRKLY